MDRKHRRDSIRIKPIPISIEEFDSVKKDAIIANYNALRNYRNELRKEYNHSEGPSTGNWYLAEIKSFDSLLEWIERCHPGIENYYKEVL